MAKLKVKGLQAGTRGPYSFAINGGDCVGLHGASGAGKSLLLRAVVDLDPWSGNIYLDDLERGSVPAPIWRKKVAMLPAQSQWWYDRVGDHFSNFDRINSTWLGQLGFDALVKDWQVSRLSTGEKQRLAILRLLSNRPACLLLDEPTASLDASNVEQVEQIFLAYGREYQVPLLWVSHDLEQLARVCDRCLFMDKEGMLSMTNGIKHGR